MRTEKDVMKMTEPYTKYGPRISCDRCGDTTTAIDAGFDPAELDMECPCGGKWRHTIKDSHDDDRLPWTDLGNVLRLHSVNNSMVVEFRRGDGVYQRRGLNQDGEEFIDDGSRWKDVIDWELKQALIMNTPFGEWVRLREKG